MASDLISRMAAIDYLMTNMGWHDEDGYEVDDADEKKAIITDLVNGIPDVDAAPVVHGRWKSVKANASNNYPFWDSKCSVCGYTTAMTQTGWLYCPHCGAKMDGEADG